MKTLYKVQSILGKNAVNLLVENEKIAYIGNGEPESDRIIERKNALLMPGLYNCHCHAPMTLFRGYAENMPLREWLDDRILPAEEKLNDKLVYTATEFACAEMLRNGIVSFTDMYFFCGSMARAVEKSGIKAELSRSIVSFDKNEDFSRSRRFLEALELAEEWDNAANGRIKIDMCAHAEYSNVEGMCAFLADYAAKKRLGFQTHISESRSEHLRCVAERKKTPTRFFYDVGAFEIPATVAHCVYVTEDDIELLKEKNVSVAHCPVSNLKLGNGVMPLPQMLKKGLNVTLGTDGCASNNTLDLLKEMYTAAILHKGVNGRMEIIDSDTMIKMATLNGALAQRRYDCGELMVGKKADFILLDMNDINNIPSYNYMDTVVYSSNSSNVILTVVDGEILYDNGVFTKIDIERLKDEMRSVCETYR